MRRVTAVPATILLINPNTSASVTARLAAEARRVAEPGVTIRAVTAPFGAPAIQTPEELGVAADAVLAAMSANNTDCDAAIIGAFGDPGLDAARAAASMPAFGLGEAGILAASADGRRFAIVTVGAAMRSDIMRRAERLGVADRLVALQFLTASVANVVRDRAALIPTVVDAVTDCAARGAQAVLLGGGPFVGLAHGVSERTAVPVLDGLHAAIALATRAAMRSQPAASSPR
jgi:Asp/Glu/hydantoin racemase